VQNHFLSKSVPQSLSFFNDYYCILFKYSDAHSSTCTIYYWPDQYNVGAIIVTITKGTKMFSWVWKTIRPLCRIVIKIKFQRAGFHFHPQQEVWTWRLFSSDTHNHLKLAAHLKESMSKTMMIKNSKRGGESFDQETNQSLVLFVYLLLNLVTYIIRSTTKTIYTLFNSCCLILGPLVTVNLFLALFCSPPIIWLCGSCSTPWSQWQ